ncbi:hypothetical protein SRHO_G00231470 [Serrasalmus rhombeus]
MGPLNGSISTITPRTPRPAALLHRAVSTLNAEAKCEGGQKELIAAPLIMQGLPGNAMADAWQRAKHYRQGESGSIGRGPAGAQLFFRSSFSSVHPILALERASAWG